MGFLKSLKGFDAYHRPEAHLTRKTASGAVVSIVGVTLMVLLFSFEMAGPDASRRGVPWPHAAPSLFTIVHPYALAASSTSSVSPCHGVPVHTGSLLPAPDTLFLMCTRSHAPRPVSSARLEPLCPRNHRRRRWCRWSSLAKVRSAAY